MSDTPISPQSGSVAAAGVALAMAMSLTFVPTVGSVSLGGAAPGVTQQTSTAIAPGAGSLTLAGVALTLTSRTIVSIAPTVGALAATGIAPGVTPQNQRAVAAGNLPLLTNTATSGIPFQWPGGMGVFSAVGTWAGATASLQFQGPDGQTYITAGTATTLTANGAGVFYLPRGPIQAVITNAGASTSITAAAQVIPNPIAGAAS